MKKIFIDFMIGAALLGITALGWVAVVGGFTYLCLM